MNEPETIKRILEECRTIAVVGLSSDPMRPSYGVAAYMQQREYRVIPVNPNEAEVLGEKAFPDLSSAAKNLGGTKIDLVDIFRNPAYAGEAVDEAIKLGIKAVWLQEGVIDTEAAKRAAEAGLLIVMDRCWLKDHYRMK